MNLNEAAWDILKDVSGEIPGRAFDRVRVLDLGVVKVPDPGLAQVLGLKVAKACMGGLGEAKLSDDSFTVSIKENVAIACLSSQMSGWVIKIGDYTALGSGPARILSKKPRNVYERVGYSESSDKAVLCLESDALPDEDACRNVLKATRASEAIIAAYSPSAYVGLIQVLARVVEMAVYRLNFLDYNTLKIKDAVGSVPIPHPGEDIMHRANDAIIYGGLVELTVDGWVEGLTEKCVSASSEAHGKSFKEIYDEAGEDFYKIGHGIFAPAEVIVKDESSGRVYTAGERSWRRI